MDSTDCAAAATYSRISDDRHGRALGVERQQEDTAAVVSAHQDWLLVEAYVDNDVSASRFGRRERPAFTRLLEDLHSGRIQAVVTWDLDRLVRQPSELEALIALSGRTGFRLFDVRGEIELRSANGRFHARILGGVAAHESDHKSERVIRQIEQAAQLGRPHGRRPYGWRRIKVLNKSGVVQEWHDELDPIEAAVVGDIAKGILSGDSLRAISTNLNARGVPSREGKAWTPTSVRTVASRWRNCGLRVHHGEPVFHGDWPSILDHQTVQAIRSVVSDPARRSAKRDHGRRTHLLTGLDAARCGVCVETLRVERVHGRYSLRCRKGCVSRREEWVNDFAERLVVRRLSRPETQDLLYEDEGDDASTAVTEAERLRLKLSQTADDFAADLLDRATYLRTVGALRNRLSTVEVLAEDRRRPKVLSGVLNGHVDAATAWSAASLDRRRAVIDVLASVRILPVSRASRRDVLDPSTIMVEWRTP
jgi:site-specific DNA recombinase